MFGITQHYVSWAKGLVAVVILSTTLYAEAQTLECATVSMGGGVLPDGSIGVIGQAVVGTMSNAQFTIEVGIVPCLFSVDGGSCPVSSAPELQTQFDPIANAGLPELKNRVLAVVAGDVGRQQAIRVRWDDQPNWTVGHAALVGQAKWMTEPFQVCENSGNGFSVTPPNCGPAPGQPQKWFWAARLDCDSTAAHYSDMTMLMDYCTGSGGACQSDFDCTAGTCGVDGVIHIFDPGIVPTKNTNQQATYSVQVIDQACAITEGNFSAALVETQPNWGDIGNGTTCPMAPPNGVADLVPDVTRALSKFSNDFCAPKKTRADVEPGALDMQVNIGDVLQLLNAFSSGSVSYGFEAGPACAAAG